MIIVDLQLYKIYNFHADIYLCKGSSESIIAVF